MKHVDLWFGDSYTVGAELAIYYGEYTANLPNHRYVRPQRDRPEFAFSHIVSSVRNVEYINFGQGGSAISWQLYNLINFCKEEINSAYSYTAFFCLPVAERTFLIDNANNHHSFNIFRYEEFHPQIEFVTYNTTLLLNQLYLICNHHGIKPYFLSMLSSCITNDELNMLPDDVWLIPPHTCLINETWNLAHDVESWKNVEDMLLNIEVFETYIKPCGNHPNLKGHKMLANKLLQEINKYHV